MGAPDKIAIREAAADDAESVASVRTQREATPLYVSRIKVHPARIWGTFRQVKWAVLIFCLTVYYVMPWIRWDRGPNAPHQALLIDLPGRRAYFFWLEIWPQEVYYITGLLILAAIGLFLVTSLLGRVWCGYACPQTVWTDLFMLVERLIEGDRNARIKLDKAPMSGSKFAKRTAKHAAWLAIALATGGAWVFYFQDAPTGLVRIVTGQAALGTYFFVGLFTATTYTLAGWAREQVCTYMCPWPRFQSAMLDEQSMIVTYEAWRGEPRGKLKGGKKDEARGDCIDCMKCVAVCPTGIDIRDGQQLECIGCGLCIDACNTVMPVIGRPRNLIAFDTLANQAAEAAGGKAVYHLIRSRTIIYAAVLLLVAGVMLAGLLTRHTIDVDVLHERSPLFVSLSGGNIRNGYTVRILNKSHEAKTFELRIAGLDDYTVASIGADQTGDRLHPLELKTPPDGVETYRIYVTVPHAALPRGHAGDTDRDERREGRTEQTKIEFGVTDPVGHESVSHSSFFIAPASDSEEK
jgi:cytochrome c oxidase accessory protein FixG